MKVSFQLCAKNTSRENKTWRDATAYLKIQDLGTKRQIETLRNKNLWMFQGLTQRQFSENICSEDFSEHLL